MHRWRRPSSVILYFVLNLFVTITNKHVLGVRTGGRIQRPYLLTASHGIASFVGCTVANSSTMHQIFGLRTTGQVRQTSISWRQHAFLALFSLFYTINISLSNLSLSLVSLRLNQNIRAAAPVLTLLISILVLGHPLRRYNIATYVSLLLITLGVILAASNPSPPTTFETSVQKQYNFGPDLRSMGILITLLGALTAVLKTILTHKLMTSLSLSLSPLSLLSILSPYAVVQALVFAHFNDELNLTTLTYHEVPWRLHKRRVILWTANASAAFMLNITSFEANRSCGPICMAVVANLKQIVLLVLPVVVASTGGTNTGDETFTLSIVLGTFLTISGGMWYACELAKSKKRFPTSSATSTVPDERGNEILGEK